ncbi:MAG: 4'-phosphopantetheinyl transferase family protein [Chitinispirillaceae bacterium]
MADSAIPKLFGITGAQDLSQREYDSFFRLASDQRKEQSERYVKREDACRSVVAEALIRYALMSVSGVVFDTLPIRRTQYGKPFIPRQSCHFNVAHSGKWVICGVDRCEIGVDIEKHRDVDFGIADHFFAEAEIDLLRGLPDQEKRLRAFYTIWSLKECYLKGIGKGLSCPLDSFAFLPSSDNISVELQLYLKSLPARHFTILNMEAGYSTAVCTCSPVESVSKVILTPGQLIEFLELDI